MSAPPGTWSIPDRMLIGLATGMGVGRLLPAPGTWGSLWGVALAALMLRIPTWAGQIGVLLALFAIGVPLCSHVARRLGEKDPGSVVWDEIVAMPLAFLGLPATTGMRLDVLLMGFVAFRFFDIVKVPPARQLETLPAGWGIMADDVVAGAYAAIIVRLWLQWVAP